MLQKKRYVLSLEVSTSFPSPVVCSRPSCVVSVAMDSKWEMIFELEDLLTTFLAVESNLPTNMVVSF